jgi:putative membrane protein
VVAVVTERCDAYPELPWKAFALCAALGALAVFAHMAAGGTAHPLAALAVPLGAGAAGALAAAFAPPWARLFLDRRRSEAEALQHAQALFLRQELFATRGRIGILMLVSLFERQVVILPDTGAATHIPRNELQGIVEVMAGRLAAGRTAEALVEGLAALESLLVARGFRAGTAGDEIAEELLMDKGA